MGTIYVEDGLGVSGPNVDFLHSVLLFVKAVGLPFPISGDWNMTPVALADSGWIAAMQAVIDASVDFTYVAGEVGDINGFFVDARLKAVDIFQSCSVLPTTIISKHRLVQFHMKGAEQKNPDKGS